MASTTMNGMKFRTKFLDKLSKTEVSMNIIEMAFDFAFDMEENYFFWLLWKLSFDDSREKALGQLGLTTDKSYVSVGMELIPSELVMPVRNELRYQYQQLHKKFLSGYDSNHEELYNAMDKDIILTAGICKRLYKYIKAERNVDKRNRVVFLLQSSGKRNFVFGGLKEFGFTNSESEVLFPKANVIASVFKEMTSEDDEYEKHIASIGTPMTYKPFDILEDYAAIPNLPDVPEEVEEPKEDEKSSQEEEEESYDDYQQLTASVVLANIKLLKKFFVAVDNLDDADIDPFEALEKEDKIRSLISSFELLS